MSKKMIRVLGIFLSLTLVLGLIHGMSMVAYAATIDNTGYPYGKAMGSSTITLVCEATGGTSYQWQSSTTESGEFTNIEGATSSEYNFSPTNYTWYRCVVDGTASKAVQAVKPSADSSRTWSNPCNGGNTWYLTNGLVAYTTNGGIFDVVGEYRKGNTKYMLCTSYAGYWDMYVGDSKGTPEKIAFSFNDVAVIVNVTFANASSNFAFSCDTMLGYYDITNYCDSAALVASLKDDKSLKHIAMVGAQHVNDETDPNAPAFGIEPQGNPMFWIGRYYDRTIYDYKDIPDSQPGYEKVKEHKKETLTDNYVCTRVEDTDSGMTMSWKQVDSVQFAFKVGTAKETGAVSGAVNYLNDTIDGLEANTDYKFEVKDADGNTTATYTITSDENGSVQLQGKDNDGTEYDLTGKTIQISKVGSEDTPAELDIKPRPSEDKDDPGTENYAKPEDITEAEVDRTQTTITLTPSGEFKQTQQYRIYNADGSEIDGQDWMAIDNGTVTISNLSPGTDYLIRAYVPATATTPRSYISDGTSITTMADSVVTKAPEAKTLEYSGSSQALVTIGTATGGTMNYALGTDAATAPAADKFAATIPTAVNVGSYYVWYKVVGDSNHFDSAPGVVTASIEKKTITVTALDQTINEGDSISTGIDYVSVGDLIKGHSISKVTLKADNDKKTIIPSEAVIIDTDGNDVTNIYNISYKNGKQIDIAAISRTVIFKVLNGSWNDGTAENKTVTLTGYEGDALKLTEKQIPEVGSKPNDNYKAGKWEIVPSADTEITVDTTYTYTYELEEKSQENSEEDSKETPNENSKETPEEESKEVSKEESKEAPKEDSWVEPQKSNEESEEEPTINPTAEPELEPQEESSPQTQEKKTIYRSEWVNGQWYDEYGDTGYAPQGGWKSDEKGYWYEDSSKWYAKSSWMKIDGDWYYFDDEGYMATNQYCGAWNAYSGGHWWVGADGKWDKSAPAVWRLTGSKWWFGTNDQSWYAKNGWLKIHGAWYYFDAEGFMLTDQYVDGYWLSSKAGGGWHE